MDICKNYYQPKHGQMSISEKRRWKTNVSCTQIDTKVSIKCVLNFEIIMFNLKWPNKTNKNVYVVHNEANKREN